MWPGAEPQGPIRCGGGMPEAVVDGLLVVEVAPAELLEGGGGIWNADGGIMPGHGCMGGGSSGGAELGRPPLELPGGGGGGGMLPIEAPGGPAFHRDGGGGTAFDMSGTGAGMPRGGAAMARGCD